ncbi:MAG: FAD-dependent oxidoreductase [Dehalococcoidia bacterium]
MKQVKCDVAIIGSGVGGTTSAALLSKAGYKVIVVEKLPFLGGRMATLDHHGFKINTGAAMIGDEIHGKLCREVGASLELRSPESTFTFRFRGKDYPSPHKSFWKTILSYAARDDAEAERAYRAFKNGIMWQEPSYSMSLDQWGRHFTDNPSILGIFHFLVLGIGINSYEIPAGEFFRQITEGAVMTWASPPLGCGQFSEALVGAIERMGGEVWSRCQALQIKTKDGAATGIVVQKDGEALEITAQAVISNAPPRKTVELAGRPLFDPGYLKDAAAIQGTPMICFKMATDKQFKGLEGSSSLSLVEQNRRIFLILDYSSICPEMAPKGKRLLEAAAVPVSIRPPYDFKKEVALAMQDLRNTIPDFERDVKILRINIAQGDWGVMGTLPGQTLPIKTPVYGLYTAGDRSAPKGWWCSLAAIKSGRLVAEDIQKRFKPA